mgnify:CR=1 FL=1
MQYSLDNVSDLKQHKSYQQQFDEALYNSHVSLARLDYAVELHFSQLKKFYAGEITEDEQDDFQHLVVEAALDHFIGKEASDLLKSEPLPYNPKENSGFNIIPLDLKTPLELIKIKNKKDDQRN